MAIYDYRCGCGKDFEINKPMSESDSLESCPTCGMILDSSHKIISRVYFSGEKDKDQYFCPGLGCVVKSDAHRKRLAKEKGLEEVGNEPVDNIHKHFDQQRDEASRNRWESLTKPTEVSSCQSTNSCTSTNLDPV